MGEYRCTVISGTGTAAPHLSPMLDAWAKSTGRELAQGTFNLCADRFVMIAHGQRHESLEPFGRLAPRHQQAKPGFSPRLYAVVLNDTVPAWLYRWSEPPALSRFVGDTPECPRARYCEIVAEEHLRTLLDVEDGDAVALQFTPGTVVSVTVESPS